MTAFLGRRRRRGTVVVVHRLATGSSVSVGGKVRGGRGTCVGEAAQVPGDLGSVVGVGECGNQGDDAEDHHDDRDAQHHQVTGPESSTRVCAPSTAVSSARRERGAAARVAGSSAGRCAVRYARGATRCTDGRAGAPRDVQGIWTRRASRRDRYRTISREQATPAPSSAPTPTIASARTRRGSTGGHTRRATMYRRSIGMGWRSWAARAVYRAAARWAPRRVQYRRVMGSRYQPAASTTAYLCRNRWRITAHRPPAATTERRAPLRAPP